MVQRDNGLSVAITNPFIWPYVRRGAERLLNDLSHYLVEHGRGVEVYAMAPVRQRFSRESIEYTLIKEYGASKLRQINSSHYFAFRLQAYLRTSGADILHCLNYFDAFAACRARSRFGLSFKVVFHVVGIPTARYFRAVPLDWLFMKTVLRQADAVLALSSFAQHKLLEDFGRETLLFPPPVATYPPAGALQAGNIAGDHWPIILFVGDVSEPRKGAKVLCQSFIDIRKDYPQAKLLFSGRADQEVMTQLIEGLRADGECAAIEFLGVGEVDDLPSLYRSATVTVLPSVWEAFGMVVVESLAAGTPVVGTNHAGIPDIIDSRSIGSLFEPGDFELSTSNRQGLTASLLEVIELAQDPATEAACKARAADYSWDKLGQEYLALYDGLHGSAGTLT